MIKSLGTKILGIVFIVFLLSGNAYAKKIKKGSGPLKLSDNTIEILHIYLTQKLYKQGFTPTFEGRPLPGFHVNGGKPVYGDYFLIVHGDQPYIWAWGSSINQNPGSTLEVFTRESPKNYKIFAKKKKIVWKGAKKKFSNEITLEELKNILRDLGFYN